MVTQKDIKSTIHIAHKTQKKMKNLYEKYMFFAGVIGQLLFYFQAYEIFSTQSAHSVSKPAFYIGFFSLASWFIYGLMIKNKVLIFSNTIALIGCGLVLVGIYLYG